MSYERPMTLRELHARLGEIIAEHDRRGWSDRNDAPIYVRVEQPKTPTGRLRRDAFVPVHFAGSGLTGLSHPFVAPETGRVDVICLEARRSAPGW